VRRRMTGFSLPVVGGGIEWTEVDGPNVAARRVIVVLEDRRVLFNPYWAEEAGQCVASVLEVRSMLTNEIAGLGAEKTLLPHLQAMRAACRQFLDTMGAAQRGGRKQPLWAPYREFNDAEVPLVIALGQLRSTMGVQIGLVAATFDLDVPDTLVPILPAPPHSDDGRELRPDFESPW
jgi:hypothetical protein